MGKKLEFIYQPSKIEIDEEKVKECQKIIIKFFVDIAVERERASKK
ncbi:hypothetical protein [Bacillus sp. EB01]|nr:hypothetical protein [Bacillus sp. EB01]